MAIAVRIYEGNQSTEGITSDFEVQWYRVQGEEGELDHNTKVARDAVGSKLGDPWNPKQNTGLILQEKRLVRWVGPDQAIVALVFAPPGRFGSFQNASTFGRSDPLVIELPVWSSMPIMGPAGPVDNFQEEPPVPHNRGRSVRAEYRILPNSDKEEVIRASGLFNGDIFLVGGADGLFYQFTGASTQETSRGTISVAYWFSRMGTVKAISGGSINSAVDLPFLSPFSVYRIDRTGTIPVVTSTDEALFTFTSTQALPGL